MLFLYPLIVSASILDSTNVRTAIHDVITKLLDKKQTGEVKIVLVLDKDKKTENTAEIILKLVDDDEVSGGLHFLNFIQRNISELKDLKGEINDIMVIKDKSRYYDYWKIIEFKEQPDKTFKDESKKFNGLLAKDTAEVLKMGKITEIGLWQKKDRGADREGDELERMKELIRKVAKKQNKTIIQMLNEENSISMLNRTIFNRHYANKLKNIGKDGCIYVCECVNFLCASPCTNVKCVDPKKLKDVKNIE